MLKTMEEMGMIPGLRAANVVYQNQRTGEITMLNSASSAFVSNTTFFPDEANIATFEDLFDLHNDILLDNLQIDSTTTIEPLNLHTEELREVPENSISSLFFHKNNALSSSSGTLLKEQCHDSDACAVTLEIFDLTGKFFQICRRAKSSIYIILYHCHPCRNLSKSELLS